jgi:hypothetical protein
MTKLLRVYNREIDDAAWLKLFRSPIREHELDRCARAINDEAATRALWAGYSGPLGRSGSSSG